MRSPADGARSAAEWALRLLALACLAMLLWRATRPAAELAAPALAAVAPAEIAAWAATASADAPLEPALARAPDATTRAWLAALARAGHPVRWRDDGVTALAAAVEPRATPAGGATLLAV